MSEFNSMLDEVYTIINESKENISGIRLPEIIFINNGTKVIWKNVKDFLRLVKRNPTHLLNFLNVELLNKVNWISESKSDGLNFRFKIKKEVLSSLLIKYVKEYVICKSCKSLNTNIEKDKEIRKYIFKCNNCKNNYSV